MKIKIGDIVLVRAFCCEANGQGGEVIDISRNPKDSMPIMVRLNSGREWPFEESELEVVG